MVSRRNIYNKLLLLTVALVLASLSWCTESRAGNLHLTWIDASDNEDGFKIERIVAGLVETTVKVGANVISYMDTGLVKGVIYCYRVRAFNSAGESPASNQPCAVAQETTFAQATITATPTAVGPGGAVTATWSESGVSTATDWIGLYRSGTDDANLLDWLYVSCSKSLGAALPSRSCSFVLPGTLPLGNYELRLFSNDGFVRLATSNIFAITSEVNPMVSLAVTPASVPVGDTIGANWSGIRTPTSTDWIGLYLPGAPDTDNALLAWAYVSCSKSAHTGLASGSCPFPLPTTAAPGTYQLRLFSNDSYSRMASSTNFTVSPSAATSPTLTVSPTATTAGSTVNAAWNGMSTPSGTDWIGLYFPGAPDTDSALLAWAYVSCSKSAHTGLASGSCPFPLPTTAAPGTYQLRFFSNDRYTRIATSNEFTISGSGSIVLSNNPTNETGNAPPPLSPQAVAKWADYDMTVRIQSKGSGDIGIMFRYQDDGNHYRFLWNRKHKKRRLEKVERGAVTVLARDSVGYKTGQTYSLQVVAHSSTLSVSVDGTQIFSVTDPTFSEGTVALYSSGNKGSHFDDIVIRDLATGMVLMSADFGDGLLSGWTIVDQGTSGTPSSWKATDGTLIQSSNIDSTFALYTARDWSDYRITGTLRSMGTGSFGVMFRYQDDRNYYRFVWDRSRRIEKVHNGLVTVLVEEDVSYVTGQAYEFEITASGAIIEIRIDHTQLFSITDSSLAGGSIALYSRQNHSVFDDITIKDLSAGETLLSETFRDSDLVGWTILGASAAWSVQGEALVSNMAAATGSFALYTK